MDSNLIHRPSAQNRLRSTRKVLEICFVLMIVADSDLVDHETGGVVKIISLSFHAYVDHPNWRSDVSYKSI
jgi:hypothetical protein